MSIFADRVKESATTTGTGNFTLSGAPAGFQTFNAAHGINGLFDYCIEGVNSNGAPTGEWEVGHGYLSGATTLVRARVFASSNANALVSFAAGNKNVFGTYAAQRGFTQGQAAARLAGMELI